jgi:hypothetical protein
MVYQIQFSNRQHASLKEMAEELGTTSCGVLRVALVLYDVCVGEKLSGNQIAVCNSNNGFEKLITGIL